MLLAAARRRVMVWRQPRLAARIARVLWVVWAVIVWNVVFDHVIVVAGRDYIVAAVRAAAVPGGSFANMDDWMRPAIIRGFSIATVAFAAVLAPGLIAIAWASRQARPACGLPSRLPRPAASASQPEPLSLPDNSR
ncbi:MAG: hypothetical protein ACRD2I_02855 [Vicinamibacterales bacterium]